MAVNCIGLIGQLKSFMRGLSPAPDSKEKHKSIIIYVLPGVLTTLGGFRRHLYNPAAATIITLDRPYLGR